MEDGMIFPPPWDPGVTPPMGIRALTAEAALSVDNPLLELTVFTKNAEIGIIEIWAGGEVQEVFGPVPLSHPIPTLTEWGLIIFCVLLFGWMAYTIIRRRQSVKIRI
jgi:hypothetical protein